MIFKFHPLASKEFQDEIDFYEKKSPELGLEFAKEIYSCIQRIMKFPKAWIKFRINEKSHNSALSLWNNLLCR